MKSSAPEEAWAFAPAPKLPGSQRTVTFEASYERVRPLLRGIPVTRIADLTLLDELRLPVFSASTPLARDLTVHMGKGVNPMAARVSAIMEAIERSSAEQADPAGVVRASYRELSSGGGALRPVDPRVFELPLDTRYTPETPIDWLIGYDFIGRASVWVPADVALNPPRDGVLLDIDTNGLASGNTLLEAVVHGICEVIERDCFSQHYFCSLFADSSDFRPRAMPILLESLPPPARDWAERAVSRGLDVVVWDITNDIGVPTYETQMADHAFPSPGATGVFGGTGTHPDAAAAVLRSITEAIQSRLGFIQGARDSYNTFPSKAREATSWEKLRWFARTHRAAFDATPSYRFDDIRQDLSFLLARLERAGIRSCIAVDLTRADLQVPVVRIRIPGLTQFSINRRRVGWRCLRHLL